MMKIIILSALALAIPAILAIYFAVTNFTYDEKTKNLEEGEKKPLMIAAVIASALVVVALMAALWKFEYFHIIEPGIRFDTAGWKWFLTLYCAFVYGLILYFIVTVSHKGLAFILKWHIKHGGHKKK